MTARERLRELAMWGDDRTADELLDDYAVEVARAERIAAYRAAADEIAADSAFHIRYGAASDYAAHYAARLRTRADQMERQ